MNDIGSLLSQRARKLSQLDFEIEAAQCRLDLEREIHTQMRNLGGPLSDIERRITEIAEGLTRLIAAKLKLVEEMETDPEGTKFA